MNTKILVVFIVIGMLFMLAACTPENNTADEGTGDDSSLQNPDGDPDSDPDGELEGDTEDNPEDSPEQKPESDDEESEIELPPIGV